MNARIENGKLILTLDLQAPTPSKSSGKTLIVATTRGAASTSAQVNGKNVTVSVNAYIKP